VNWPLPTSIEQFANVVVDGDGKLVKNVGLLLKNYMSPCSLLENLMNLFCLLLW
jgi:hypothetical protein